MFQIGGRRIEFLTGRVTKESDLLRVEPLIKRQLVNREAGNDS